MIDPALRRADALLAELTELVETARTLPMSTSCLVPREQVLDLLDGLREAMPSEMTDARQVMNTRDALLADAKDEAENLSTAAVDQLLKSRTMAAEQAAEILAAAKAQALGIVNAAEAEQQQLLSASGVYQRAAAEATELRSSAEADATRRRAEADEYAVGMRKQAEAFADRTLGDLVDILERTQATAENGRAALSRRTGSSQT